MDYTTFLEMEDSQDRDPTESRFVGVVWNPETGIFNCVHGDYLLDSSFDDAVLGRLHDLWCHVTEDKVEGLNFPDDLSEYKEIKAEYAHLSPGSEALRQTLVAYNQGSTAWAKSIQKAIDALG